MKESEIIGIALKEGLSDWKIEFSGGQDGLCLHESKKIIVGMKYKPVLLLVLHEMAHAQCSKEEDGHNNVWVGKYEKLLRRYVFGVVEDET